jgi:hypothetical protein
LQIIAHYLAVKRNPDQAGIARAYLFAGKAAPGYQMAKLHIRLINDVASVINGDPGRARQAGRRLHPELRRIAGAGDHPGGRSVGADLDRREGGVRAPAT